MYNIGKRYLKCFQIENDFIKLEECTDTDVEKVKPQGAQFKTLQIHSKSRHGYK